MNAGILDAAVLTDAIAATFAENRLDPLEAYVTQRHRAIEQGVNPFTPTD